MYCTDSSRTISSHDDVDIAEGFAFSYVGLSMWEYVDDGFHIQFSLFIMLVVIVSRLITILALCSICSCFCKSFHMPIPEQLGFTLGGFPILLICIRSPLAQCCIILLFFISVLLPRVS